MKKKYRSCYLELTGSGATGYGWIVYGRDGLQLTSSDRNDLSEEDALYEAEDVIDEHHRLKQAEKTNL